MYNSILLAFNFFGKIKDFIWQIALLIAVVVIIIAFIKWPNARIYIGVIFVVVSFMSGIICGLQLNTYYKASGGIIGTLSNWVNPTEVKIKDGVGFEFVGIEMRKMTGNTYRATTTTTDVVNVPIGSNYCIIVNDVPCMLKAEDTTSNYLIANYSYTFNDESLQEILTDTIKIRVSFNKLNTSISLTTEGGDQACKLWNEFFNKNGFKITLTTDKFISSSGISYGSGDVKNLFCIATFMKDDEVFNVQTVVKGSSIEEYTRPYKSGYTFVGWQVNGEDIDIFNYVINEDTTFIALFKEGSDSLVNPFDKPTITIKPTKPGSGGAVLL